MLAFEIIARLDTNPNIYFTDSDTCRLLADLHHNESLIRRSLIFATVNDSVKDTATEPRICESSIRRKTGRKVKISQVAGILRQSFQTST